MRKHRYHSTDIKQVNWTELGQVIASQRMTLSVDVAKQDFMANWMLPKYEVVKITRWRHPEETPILLRGLQGLAATASIEVAM